MTDTKKTAADLMGELNTAVENLKTRQLDHDKKQKEYTAAQDELNRGKKTVSKLRTELNEALNELAGEPNNPLVSYSN